MTTGRGWAAPAFVTLRGWARTAAYQRLTPVKLTAAKASTVKISTECCPKGTTMKAASSGPKDCPKLPPT